MEGIQYIGEEMIGRLLPLQEEHMVVVLLKVPPQGRLRRLLLPGVSFHRQPPGRREAIGRLQLPIAEL